MIVPVITPLQTLALHDSFMFLNDLTVCLIVAVDGDLFMYYREDSDHLFSCKIEHGVDVWYLREAEGVG